MIEREGRGEAVMGAYVVDEGVTLRLNSFDSDQCLLFNRSINFWEF